MTTRSVQLRYGSEGMVLRLPGTAAVLEGRSPPPVPDAAEATAAALARPIGTPPLAELVAARKPHSVAVTVSDITRPAPNRDFLPAILEVLNRAGVGDSHIVIIIGTGMHRPTTPAERKTILGEDILSRIEVIDHRADDPATLLRVSADPPVSVCRRFAEADFRIVTGLIEPHFMAGFSGGRKGVCPALVDLETIRRFHGYDTLADPRADNGILAGNPCHEIALRVAGAVGVDFLFNVAITRDRRIAGIYCGDLVEAHRAGCRQVAEWTTAELDGTFDLVITCAGGFPLDQTFYQTVKGLCSALPALAEHSTLLMLSHCGEGIGSSAYAELMLRWHNDWRGFLAHLAANRHETKLDQWELQMQCRVLDRIGIERLWFVSGGMPAEMQKHLAVTPILGGGDDARTRAQRAIDGYLANHPGARTAVIPDGPYTMPRNARAAG